MELVRLRLKNFLSFKELNHKFLNEPVLIKGKNLTEIETKETNGTGKSTMLSGIAYAILASPLKKQVIDKELIRWGEEEAEIWLDIYCPIRKQTLNIHRVLRQKGSSTLELTLNEEEGSVQFATVNDGNAYILNWIGITSEDLKSFYILNKENFKSFVSSSNTDKLALINRFIKAEKLDDADKIIKDKVRPLQVKQQEAKDNVSRLEGELGVYNKQLENEQQRNIEEERNNLIETIEKQIDNTLLEYDKCERKIDECNKVISLALKDISTMVDKTTEVNEILKELNEISFEDRYKEVEDRRKKALSEKDKVSEKFGSEKMNKAGYESEIIRLQGLLRGTITCPNCGHKFVNNCETPIQEIYDKIKENSCLVEKSLKDIKKYRERLDKFDEEEKKFDKEKSAIRIEEDEVISALNEAKNELEDIKREVKRNRKLIDDNKNEITELEKKKKTLNEECEKFSQALEKVKTEGIETRIEDIENEIVFCKKKLEKARKEYDECEKNVSDMLQWGERFKEFKMSLACEQLKVIQNFANLCLQRQKSELRLSIDGFKRNAKGQVKSEITVLVINGDGEYKPFYSFSGGERARIEISLIQAFQEMINGTNPYGGLHFLMIDEVLEGTDPLGLALLLESMNESRYPVYVISHVMNIRAGITTFTVVKENGYSYIEDI